jgi:hypothetical protein
LVVAGQLANVPAASAEPPPLAAAAAVAPIDLGTAETYSALGGTGVANTGAGTVLSGDLGLSPSGAITGFPPGTLAGTIHDKDAAAAQAQTDRGLAYDEAAALPSTTTFSGDQAGKTFKPGVHTSAAAFSNTGTMTLDADGDQSAVFVFQIGAAYGAAASSKVVLTDGALANNVFWQVVGATSLGAGATSVGTYLSAGAFTLGDGASLKGRALTPDTVALTNNALTEPKDDFIAPIVTIDGGEARSTKDTTPAISGTTDEPAGKAVTVTVGGQTLTTAAGASGAWSVSANALAQGPHTVVASVTDGSQNIGTATQVLTVDVTAPVVTIDGGGTNATNDRTPTITGTTDGPTDTPVTVTVGGQTLTTAVGASGTWSVDAATLTEAAHHVVASVDDAAQNTGAAHQILTVDVTLPVVAIDGGATRSTTDTSPWIEGMTAEQAGTTVHITVGGQNLTATVLAGGTWSVSATTLSAGPHEVVASVTDAAQNTGTARQTLTVGPVAPTERFRPDAAIRISKGSYVGVGTYGAGQRVTKQLRGKVRTATFEVRVTNRGDATDRMEVVGTARNRGLKVTYLVAGQNVTDVVTAGRYTTRALAPAESTSLVIKVTRTRAARPDDRRTFVVRAVSSHAPAEGDTVAAVVKVAG